MLATIQGLLSLIPVAGPILAGAVGLAATFIKPAAAVAGDVEKDAVGLGTAILGNQTAMDVIAGAAIAGLAFLALSQHGQIDALHKSLAVAQAQASSAQAAYQTEAKAFAVEHGAVLTWQAKGAQRTQAAQTAVTTAHGGLVVAQQVAQHVQAYQPADTTCPATLKAVGDVLAGKEDQ